MININIKRIQSIADTVRCIKNARQYRRITGDKSFEEHTIFLERDLKRMAHNKEIIFI